MFECLEASTAVGSRVIHPQRKRIGVQRFRFTNVVVFVPGNPGLKKWYSPFLRQFLVALGPANAFRGATKAVHFLDPDKAQVLMTPNIKGDTIINKNRGAKQNPSLPRTANGQFGHTCAFFNLIVQEFESSTLNHVGWENQRLHI